MKSIQDILALCIEDIKAGRYTLEDCLDRYPSMCQELEPLLKIALSIQEPPSFKPTNDFRIRARVQLMDYILDKRNVKKSWRDFLNHGIRQSWYSGRLKTVSIIVAIILAFSALGTGIVYASKDSLPGDTLYSMKIGTEQVRGLLTVNDFARIKLELMFADIRLEEIEALANRNFEGIPLAVKGYENNIAIAIDKAENNRDRDISAEVLEMVALSVLKHISIIDGISDIVKVADKESVKQAGEIAFMAQFRVLRALAGEDPVRATEINIETMQNRLNRANARSDEGENIEAEDSLRQLIELHRFAEEISQIAKESGHNTTVIDALNAYAKSAQLEIINNMYGKVSDEIIESVKEVIGVSVGNYNKEDKESSEKGYDNDILEKPDNYSEETSNKSDELGNDLDKPDNKPEEADDKTDEPSGSSGEPGNGSGKPGNGSGEPGD